MGLIASSGISVDSNTSELTITSSVRLARKCICAEGYSKWTCGIVVVILLYAASGKTSALYIGSTGLNSANIIQLFE
jgi:hypothetical protein